MPRQNRVTPFGEIVATPERGTFMGNRGVLHDAESRIKRSWQVRRWLVCVLEFRGRNRAVMTPGSYTELFFLDEATALAAGHRPCAECRHKRFLDYCTAWNLAKHGTCSRERPTADEIDGQLHTERIASDRSKLTTEMMLDDLPEGAFVILDDSQQTPYLVRGEKLFLWSPGCYGRPRKRPSGILVKVLTPPSTVAAIRSGYVPDIHPSACS